MTQANKEPTFHRIVGLGGGPSDEVRSLGRDIVSVLTCFASCERMPSDLHPKFPLTSWTVVYVGKSSRAGQVRTSQ